METTRPASESHFGVGEDAPYTVKCFSFPDDEGDVIFWSNSFGAASNFVDDAQQSDPSFRFAIYNSKGEYCGG